MKATGIIRNVDDLGRIVIPKELRHICSINAQDPIEIFIENECIILKKYEPGCIFCGNIGNSIFFKNKVLCRRCIEFL